MTMTVLRLRLAYLKGGAVPSPMSRSSFYFGPQNKPTFVHGQGDLRVIWGLMWGLPRWGNLLGSLTPYKRCNNQPCPLGLCLMIRCRSQHC